MQHEHSRHSGGRCGDISARRIPNYMLVRSKENKEEVVGDRFSGGGVGGVLVVCVRTSDELRTSATTRKQVNR